MGDLASRIANLSPEKRKILEEKLKEKKNTILEDIDLSKLTVTRTKNYTPIEPAAEREYYPLSSTQKGLFILNQMGNNPTLPLIYILEGALNVTLFEETFKKLIKRHEAFRVSFELVNGEPVQKLHQEVDFKVHYQEIDPAMTDNCIKDFFQPFDISRPPLLKSGLLKIAENKYIFLIALHHLIADGSSFKILLQEFSILYQGGDLPGLRVQYKDYAVWQNEFTKTQAFGEQEKYWMQRFPNEIPILDLPLDFPRANRQYLHSKVLNIIIPKEATGKFTRLANNCKVSLHTLFFALFTIFLSRYSGQEEIVIGSVHAGRQNMDLENMIGMLIKVIPIKVEVDPEKTLSAYIESTHNTILTAFENLDYTFDRLIEKIPLERRNEIDSLSNVEFIFHNEYEIRHTVNVGELTLTDYPFDLMREESKQLDLKLEIWTEENGELSCLFEYNSNLFKEETANRMARHFLNLCDEVTVFPENRLMDLKMITPDDKERILAFNYKGVAYQKEQTVHALFSEQAERAPERIALRFNGRQLTYQELDHRSNQLANILRQKGVGRESLVGIMIERSPEQLVAILGILKAGGAYIPIDPDYPVERIRYMVENSGAKLLLTQTHLTAKTSGNLEKIIIDEKWTLQGESVSPTNINTPSDLAYIIYTSGSTGVPKGVMIEHRNIISYVASFKDEFKIGMDDTVLQQASYSFDVFVEEVFPVLLSGGSILIAQKSQILDLDLLVKILRENGVTLISCSPLLLNELNKVPLVESIHTYISGGDVLKAEYITNLVKKAKVYNTYGPTETTVCATYHRCNEEIVSNTPIGRPILNYKVYILDPRQNILPVGIPGEICIAGEGLSRGYLNQPELTKEKFVPNPFVEVDTSQGTRMYKTGDRGRWLANGEIEFLGRLDYQVKIRGFRIEPGEIESRLLRHEMMQAAVVIDREDPSGDKYLCAYIIVRNGLARSNDDSITRELRMYLSKDLPEYMVPSYFIRLDQLPLTPNGKINRILLPDPTRIERQSADYVPPANDIEEKLTAIWREVLNVPRISSEDDFFALGGNSLKIIVAASRIRKEFKVDISINNLFQTPTIKAIGLYIASAGKEQISLIEKVAERPYYPTSSVQKRLYTVNRLEPESMNYNIPFLLMVEEELDLSKTENAVQTLLQRHESLRTSFYVKEGELVQVIQTALQLKIEYYEATEPDLEKVISRFMRPFDLSEAPLTRVGIVKLPDKKHLLMIDMHHIISDETSINILVREFFNVYNNQELAPLRIQYKDYVIWQNRFFTSDAFKKQEKYWKEYFPMQIPVLNLPLDYPRPEIPDFAGNQIDFEVDEETARGVKTIALQTGATVFMVLLAAYNALLANLTCDEDIIVGIPVTGRTHADLENIVGMFVNTLPILSFPSGQKSFVDFLGEVRENMLKAYENQDYPLDMLLEQLEIPRDATRNPLFDTMFAFRDLKNNGPKLELKFHPYRFENKIAKVDLMLNATEVDTGINFSFEYRERLFREETIRNFAEYYLAILKNVVKNTNIGINELGIQNNYESVELGEIEFSF